VTKRSSRAASRTRLERATISETRRRWRRTANELDATVAKAPERGSVLDQLLAIGEAVPAQLPDMLRLVATQGTQFLRASLDVAAGHEAGVRLAPVAPLARSALLAFSKVVSIATPLCWEVRGIGPALQHYHDGLIDMVVEQDRQTLFDPSSAEATIWQQGGRAAMVSKIGSLREALGEAALKPNGPKHGHVLVDETSWVVDAQAKTIAFRDLVGAPRDEFTDRMRWAWHRGSIVAHAGFATRATPTGLEVLHLSGEEASALIGCATELALTAQHVLEGVWVAAAAPSSFTFNADHRLPKGAPELQAAR